MTEILTIIGYVTIASIGFIGFLIIVDQREQLEHLRAIVRDMHDDMVVSRACQKCRRCGEQKDAERENWIRRN